MNLILILLCLVSFVACQKNSPPVQSTQPPARAQVDGGESSSGGNGIERRSTIEQVRAAIPDPYHFAIRFGDQMGYWGYGPKTPSGFGSDWRFNRNPKHQNVLRTLSERGYEKYFQLHSAKRIVPIENGSCSSAGKDDHDASFSSTTANGDEICISLERLQRFPPAELTLQLQGLMIHETAHALGFNEDAARYAQQYFFEQYNDGKFALRREISRRLDIFTNEAPIKFRQEIDRKLRLQNFYRSSDPFQVLCSDTRTPAETVKLILEAGYRWPGGAEFYIAIPSLDRALGSNSNFAFLLNQRPENLNAKDLSGEQISRVKDIAEDIASKWKTLVRPSGETHSRLLHPDWPMAPGLIEHTDGYTELYFYCHVPHATLGSPVEPLDVAYQELAEELTRRLLPVLAFD